MVKERKTTTLNVTIKQDKVEFVVFTLACKILALGPPSVCMMSYSSCSRCCRCTECEKSNYSDKELSLRNFGTSGTNKINEKLSS